MKSYEMHETYNTYPDGLFSTARTVRVHVRDDYYGTYDYEESFIAVEQYIEKHSNSLDSILDRYCF